MMDSAKYNMRNRALKAFVVPLYWLLRLLFGDPTRELLNSGLLTIGKHTYGMPRILSYEGDSKVVIGNYSSIAVDVVCIPGGIHPPDWVSTYPFRIIRHLPGISKDMARKSKGDIVIGSDVWIGRGATILSGVKIGDGAIIAAEALVARNVPAYSVFGGNPGELLYYRFPEDRIRKLRAICWWNWDDAQVDEAINLLSSSNIDEFIARYHRPDGTDTPTDI